MMEVIKMKNSLIAVVSITLVFLTLFANFQLKQTKAQPLNYNEYTVSTYPITPSISTNLTTGITYLTLPGIPLEAIYANGEVWVAFFSCSGIGRINVTTKTGIVYNLTSISSPRRLTVDSEGNIWALPPLMKLNPNTNIVRVYQDISNEGDVKFHNGYIWVVVRNSFTNSSTLFKISINDEIVDSYGIFGESVIYIKGDGDYLWISLLGGFFDYPSGVFCAPEGSGYITKFNILTGTFEKNITLWRPLGIDVDNENVYVAEFSNTTIAVINKTTYEVSRIDTGIQVYDPIQALYSDGVYCVYKSNVTGNIYWTSNEAPWFGGAEVGFIADTIRQKWQAKKFTYFMVEVPESSIWFTASGSAYIGIVEDYRSGDINRDKVVDVKDYQLLKRQIPTIVQNSSDADLNVDGKIDIKDYQLIKGFVGRHW
jgi:hypothetical protein